MPFIIDIHQKHLLVQTKKMVNILLILRHFGLYCWIACNNFFWLNDLQPSRKQKLLIISFFKLFNKDFY